MQGASEVARRWVPPREAHKADALVWSPRDGDPQRVRTTVDVSVSPSQDFMYVRPGDLEFARRSVSPPEVHAVERLVDFLDLVSQINWDGLHSPD
jgi:hypothetical protein